MYGKIRNVRAKMHWDYNENAGKVRGKKEEKVEVIERW